MDNKAVSRLGMLGVRLSKSLESFLEEETFSSV